MEQTENLSVKKNAADSYRESMQQFSTLTGTWVNASAEFFVSLLEAGASSARTFKNVMDCEKVTLEQFPGKLVSGIAESNTAFFQQLSNSSRKFSETLQTSSASAETTIVTEIDYERLAKLVADELKKRKVV
ncbi:hypothetical protein ACX0G9_26430 [Flavitalea flava]